jgi:antibiotic biosynthesis monooxygenase (ABM) superfamily enzyme
MTAFNVVRFRVKPGREQEFLDAHQKVSRDWPGLRRVNMLQTGDRSYCIIAEWDDMDSLAWWASCPPRSGNRHSAKGRKSTLFSR